MLLKNFFTLGFVQAQRIIRSERIVYFHFRFGIKIHHVSGDEVQFYVPCALWVTGVFDRHVMNRHDDTQCVQIKRSEERTI
jgi:hypothetical protein